MEVANDFLSVVQGEYADTNPYHNATHAADVAQSFSHLIVAAGLSNYSDPLMRFAALVSAIVHDVRHPGVTNQFLIDAADPVAVRYNDRSPLEQMHCATAFEIMRVPEYNVAANVPAALKGVFRRAVLDMVMMTDNGEHHNLLARV